MLELLLGSLLKRHVPVTVAGVVHQKSNRDCPRCAKAFPALATKPSNDMTVYAKASLTISSLFFQSAFALSGSSA
jgi:hypothetical protein